MGNEVCRILPDIPRSWLLFVSEHLRLLVTISSNRFECYTEYYPWSYCFSVPSYCLSRSVLQKTINISQSFQDGTWEKKALPCRNVQKGLIGASWKFRGKFFSIKRENFTVWISELFPVDLNFSSSNCDTTKDDKHLKIISQWRLRHVIEKKKENTFSLQKYLNRFDLHIVETLNTKTVLTRKKEIPFQSATNAQKSS